MEDLMKSMQALLEQPAKEEDYMDEEGFLCCGKCHTRKEVLFDVPLVLGGRIMDRHPTNCRCLQEKLDKQDAESSRRDHECTVNRLKSVCFTAPSLKEHCFENATMVPPEILKMAHDFVDRWDEIKKANGGLIFWGPNGTCKSYTAECIANALMEREVSVLMRSTAYFTSADFEDVNELCRDINRYELVIFDDLGAERGTEYGMEVMFLAINARCESGKPTIFTTNLTLDELKNARDLAHRRIYDRVLEMGVPIYFGGNSVRRDIHRRKLETFQKVFKGGE